MLTNKFYLNFANAQRQDQQLIRAIYSAHLIWSKRYPEWHNAFFDTHFLRTRVIPLFAERQAQQSVLDPATLAQEWIDQFPGTENRRHRLIAELTPAVADFLQLVAAEERYFASEAARRQEKLNKLWTQLPLSGAIRSLVERLVHKRSQPVTDCE